MTHDKQHCDDCGDALAAKRFIPVAHLPVDIESASAGESAVLCYRCAGAMLNCPVVAAATRTLDALKEILDLTHDDHEDCRYCDRPEENPHDPEAACGRVRALIAEAEKRAR